MEKRDLKHKIMPICEYAMLEGRNTDWINVIESIGIVEGEYNSNSGFDYLDEKEFVELIERLLEAVEIMATLGESESAIVYKLSLISKIYFNVQKWNV